MRNLLVAFALLVPLSSWGLATDARYARASLGYVPPAIASRLAGEAQADWKRRVAQDVSVWLAAEDYSTRLLAWSRFRPGIACLTQRVGKEKAHAWLGDVIKAHLREQRDLDRFNLATVETQQWPEGPAEDCSAPPRLLHS